MLPNRSAGFALLLMLTGVVLLVGLFIVVSSLWKQSEKHEIEAQVNMTAVQMPSNRESIPPLVADAEKGQGPQRAPAEFGDIPMEPGAVGKSVVVASDVIPKQSRDRRTEGSDRVVAAGKEPLIDTRRSTQTPANAGTYDSFGSGEPDEVLDPADLGIPPEGILGISGRVLTKEGEPVPGIEMIAVASHLFYELADGMDLPRQSTATGFDGSYSFAGLIDGEYQIRVPETDLYSGASIGVRAGVQSADLTLKRKERTVLVRGQVVATDGLPLAGAKVMPSGQIFIFADPSGRYEYALALAGANQRYSVTFQHQGYQELRVNIETEDYEGNTEVLLDVELEPLASTAAVTGGLLDQEGAPIAGERLRMASPRLKLTYQAVSDAKGRFGFPNVVLGTDYDLQISPKGPFEGYRQQGIEVGSEGQNLDVVLQRLKLGRVSGRMLDIDDNPVPDFSLWLRSSSAGHRRLEVAGDAAGQFEVEEVPEGNLTFQTRTAPTMSITGLQLQAGEELQTELYVDWGSYQLRGRLIDGQGQPVPGARIYLDWRFSASASRSTASRLTTADAQGQFLFTQLGPGPHRVRVTNVQGFEPATADYEVGGGGGDLVIQLEPVF